MMASNNGPESNPRYCAVCRKYGGMLIDGEKAFNASISIITKRHKSKKDLDKAVFASKNGL